ncbi:hypothetical protein N7481_007031 [Penicillium waksmanii]|uniref:uncharacterized protein n=1 Tax=Penicillium waksmanii TaxID=69791 RepID=UPI002548E345|nr:uncharacterized protein N7481_007031 [Penicillium waksmanii]KAJ5979733.1 hypothetical protein N7481_007031 [Penicillium waksmanii]
MQPALAPAPHPSMQSAQDHDDQVLHDQLLAVQHNLGQRPQPQPGQQQHHLQPNPAGSRDQANIDPAISGAAMMAAPQTPTQPHQGSPDDTPKGFGKRELSTSKRAAQNRAAQRAFRQRKETYIRKLEDEVKNIDAKNEQLKQLSNENYALRDYVITLQSRLMDLQADVPELPPNIDLNQPRPDINLASSLGGPSGSMVAPTGPHQGQHPGNPNDDMNSLNRIASAGLMRKPHEETNFMSNNFQPQPQPGKRMRGDDNQEDVTVPKQEGHGIPLGQ